MSGNEAAEDAPRALRLTFSYEGDQVRLQEARVVEMTVPASSDLDVDVQRSGSWVELRDADGRRLYERVLGGLVPTDVEIVPEGEGQPFTRAVLHEVVGTFDVVVPVLEGGDEVALLTSPPTREPAAEEVAPRPAAATEVAVVSLRDLPEWRAGA